MDNPDTTNKAVVGSGVVVTVSVPTGVFVSSGKILTTLPDVDRNVPVSSGKRGNEKKSAGALVVKRSG
jgi:NAD(P)H-hydrate repair Nnr-like enzyme with NAD(P)H-hydrate epimerase domain